MEPNVPESSRRHRRRINGVKGEINVKWAVMPIWERENDEKVATENFSKQLPQSEVLRRSNRESMMLPPRRYSVYSTHPAGGAPGEMQQQQQPVIGEGNYHQ